MFGSEMLDQLFGVLEKFTVDDLDEKIADHQRRVTSLKRQKKLLQTVVKKFKADQERSKKEMAEFRKKQKAAMKKMPKFPPGVFAYGAGSVPVVAAPAKKG